MKKFVINFQIVDHSSDDYASLPIQRMSIERTNIESPCNKTATMEFCSNMKGETFVIHSVEEMA